MTLPWTWGMLPPEAEILVSGHALLRVRLVRMLGGGKGIGRLSF